jgi:hypothetical protein
MLAHYEAIRADLAKDSFRDTRYDAARYVKASEGSKPSGTAQATVMEQVGKIASAPGLEPQREAFRAWSAYVIGLTQGVAGFYVIHCPLPGCGDWLQTNPQVDNPYMGKSMHDCGEVQK